MADQEAQNSAGSASQNDNTTGESSTSATASSSSTAQTLDPTTISTTTSSEPRTCTKCGAPELDPETKSLKSCPLCKSAHYCNRDCLKADFKVHKKQCARLAQEYAKTAEFRPVSRTVPKDGFKGGLQKWQFDT